MDLLRLLLGQPVHLPLAAFVARTAAGWSLSPHEAWLHCTGSRLPFAAMPDLLVEIGEMRTLETVFDYEKRTAGKTAGDRPPDPPPFPAEVMDWYGGLRLEAGRAAGEKPRPNMFDRFRMERDGHTGDA